jgi:hypothetical protein
MNPTNTAQTKADAKLTSHYATCKRCDVARAQYCSAGERLQLASADTGGAK